MLALPPAMSQKSADGRRFQSVHAPAPQATASHPSAAGKAFSKTKYEGVSRLASHERSTKNQMNQYAIIATNAASTRPRVSRRGGGSGARPLVASVVVM